MVNKKRDSDGAPLAISLTPSSGPRALNERRSSLTALELAVALVETRLKARVRWRPTAGGEEDLDPAAGPIGRLELPLAATRQLEGDAGCNPRAQAVEDRAQFIHDGFGALPSEAEVEIVAAHGIGVAGNEDGLARAAGALAGNHLARDAVEDWDLPRPVPGRAVE